MSNTYVDTAQNLPDFDDQWDYSDPAGTEKVFRKILAEHPDAALGWRLELETQIARTLGLQQKFDEAHAVLDEVAERLDTTPVASIRHQLERLAMDE